MTKTPIIAPNGKWLWARNGGGRDLSFYSMGGTTWETFDIIPVGEKVKIQTNDGKHYIRAIGGGKVDATSLGGNTWETFTVVPTTDNKIAFRTYDGKHYLSASGLQINARATKIGPNEQFSTNLEPTNKIDLLPYLTISAANAKKGLYLREDMQDARYWGRPKSRTVCLDHPNGDISIFEVMDNSPLVYMYTKYIKADEKFYILLGMYEFFTVNPAKYPVPPFKNHVWVSDGDSKCGWIPRYCEVGYSKLHQNWNCYQYSLDGKPEGDNGFWPMEVKLISVGDMDVGGDIGKTSVAVISFQPNPAGGGDIEYSYYAKGWGRVGWTEFKADRTIRWGPAWWTRVMDSDLLPDLEKTPKPYCGMPTVAIGGQKVPKDRRCK